MKRFYMGLLMLSITPFLLLSQIPSPVSLSVENAPSSVETGQVFELTVGAEIEDPWHLYSIYIDGEGPIPTSFSIKNENARLAGKVTESEPIRQFDPNFEIEVGWHDESATFTIPVVINDPTIKVLEVDVRYMACDDRSCLPPRTITLSHPIAVTGAEIREGSPFDSDPADSEILVGDGDTSGLNEGFWGFLWIAITAGFAALLTPCVFPMIPLTVSFFTKHSDGSRARAFGQALFFGFSIIATFTLLGVILSLFIGASGATQFASNPWVNLFIGLIFVVFSFSLLGLFELQLPYQVTNFLNKKSNESQGILGILFMGLTISAVSFSCTAPFVGGILAATSTGKWFYPIFGMIAFSGAFALPFIFFAMFPKALNSLPRSGQWMNTVKVMLGFIELGAAFKFISNADLVWQWGLLSRPITIAFWIVLAGMAGFYLLGKITMPHEQKSESVGFFRIMSSIPFLAFSLYLIPGLLGASLGIWDAWLPPRQATDVSIVSLIAGQGSGQDVEGEWSQSYDEVLDEAKNNSKPVFIDFTGYTCTNCRAMESNVFPNGQVKALFSKFEKAKIYTDDGEKGPENQLFQFNLTGTVALPTYAIVDPKSGKLLGKISGYTSKEDFIKFLNAGINRYNQIKSI